MELEACNICFRICNYCRRSSIRPIPFHSLSADIDSIVADVCNAIKIQLMHDVSLQLHRNKDSVHVGFWKFPKGKHDGAPLF